MQTEAAGNAKRCLRLVGMAKARGVKVLLPERQSRRARAVLSSVCSRFSLLLPFFLDSGEELEGFGPEKGGVWE